MPDYFHLRFSQIFNNLSQTCSQFGVSVIETATTYIVYYSIYRLKINEKNEHDLGKHDIYIYIYIYICFNKHQNIK